VAIKVKRNPVLKYQTQRVKEFNKICQESAENVDKIIPKNKLADIIIYEERLSLLTDKTINKIRKLIIKGVSEIIYDTLKHYNQIHEDMAGVRLPNKKLNDIHIILLKRFATEPFKGSTFDARLERLKKRVLTVINKNLYITLNEEDTSNIRQEIKEVFYTFDYITGGSLRGGGETLLISEENRYYHETAVEFFKRVGVSYVRFCLQPYYNEDDICYEIASYENPAVLEKFSHVDPQGLYRLDELPEYPRPRARYYLKPLYHIGYLNL